MSSLGSSSTESPIRESEYTSSLLLRVSASRAAANSPFEEGGATEELSRARAAPPMEQNATEELPTRFSNVTPRRRGRKSSGPLYSAGGTATQSYVPFDPFVYAPPPSRGSPARPFSLEADDVLGPGGTQVLEGTQQLYDDDDDDDVPVGATQQLDAMSPWGAQPLPTQELDDDDDENLQGPPARRRRTCRWRRPRALPRRPTWRRL